MKFVKLAQESIQEQPQELTARDVKEIIERFVVYVRNDRFEEAKHLIASKGITYSRLSPDQQNFIKDEFFDLVTYLGKLRGMFEGELERRRKVAESKTEESKKESEKVEESKKVEEKRPVDVEYADEVLSKITDRLNSKMSASDFLKYCGNVLGDEFEDISSLMLALQSKGIVENASKDVISSFIRKASNVIREIYPRKLFVAKVLGLPEEELTELAKGVPLVPPEKIKAIEEIEFGVSVDTVVDAIASAKNYEVAKVLFNRLTPEQQNQVYEKLLEEAITINQLIKVLRMMPPTKPSPEVSDAIFEHLKAVGRLRDLVFIPTTFKLTDDQKKILFEEIKGDTVAETEFNNKYGTKKNESFEMA